MSSSSLDYRTPSPSPSRTRSIRHSLMRSNSIIDRPSRQTPYYRANSPQVSLPSNRRKSGTPSRCNDGLPTGGAASLLPSPPSTPASPQISPLGMSVHEGAAPWLRPQFSAEQLENQRLIFFVNEKNRNPDQESCARCLLFFQDSFLSFIHSWTHGPAGPYHCSICGEILPNRSAFVTHIEDPRHMHISGAGFQERAMVALQTYMSHTGVPPPSLAQAIRFNVNQREDPATH